jgi:hypothetical protein
MLHIGALGTCVFAYVDHRRPGYAHVHFPGATAFGSVDGFALEDGDEMAIEFEGPSTPQRVDYRADHRDLVASGHDLEYVPL